MVAHGGGRVGDPQIVAGALGAGQLPDAEHDLRRRRTVELGEDLAVAARDAPAGRIGLQRGQDRTVAEAIAGERPLLARGEPDVLQRPVVGREVVVEPVGEVVLVLLQHPRDRGDGEHLPLQGGDPQRALREVDALGGGLLAEVGERLAHRRVGGLRVRRRGVGRERGRVEPRQHAVARGRRDDDQSLLVDERGQRVPQEDVVPADAAGARGRRPPARARPSARRRAVLERGGQRLGLLVVHAFGGDEVAARARDVEPPGEEVAAVVAESLRRRRGGHGAGTGVRDPWVAASTAAAIASSTRAS